MSFAVLKKVAAMTASIEGRTTEEVLADAAALAAAVRRSVAPSPELDRIAALPRRQL